MNLALTQKSFTRDRFHGWASCFLRVRDKNQTPSDLLYISSCIQAMLVQCWLHLHHHHHHHLEVPPICPSPNKLTRHWKIIDPASRNPSDFRFHESNHVVLKILKVFVAVYNRGVTDKEFNDRPFGNQIPMTLIVRFPLFVAHIYFFSVRSICVHKKCDIFLFAPTLLQSKSGSQLFSNGTIPRICPQQFARHNLTSPHLPFIIIILLS